MNNEMNAGEITVEGRKSMLATDIRNTVADAAGLAGQVAVSASDDIAAVRTRIEDGLSEAGSRLDAAGSAVTACFARAARTTRAYVDENPWKAVGMSAAVGLVLAFFLRRR